MFSVVIPMYNEHSVIRETITRLTAAFGPETELLFVNDGSTDDSEAIVSEAAKVHKNIRLVTYPVNKGKGCAVRTGMLEANGDIIIYTDCDLAYGTDQIKDIVSAIEKEKADIVIGSRAAHPEGYAGYTFLRKLISRAYIGIVCLISGLRLTDSQAGIKCYQHEAARAVFADCTVNGFAFDLEALMIAQKKGYTRVEFPVTICVSDIDLDHTSSVHLIKDSYHMFWDILKIRARLSKPSK